MARKFINDDIRVWSVQMTNFAENKMKKSTIVYNLVVNARAAREKIVKSIRGDIWYCVPLIEKHEGDMPPAPWIDAHVSLVQ